MKEESLARKQIVNIICFIIFTSAIFFTDGLNQFVAIALAVACILLLLLEWQKAPNKFLTIAGAFMVALLSGVSAFQVYSDYYLQTSILFAKIGLIILVCIFIIVAILFTLMFFALLIKK